jgi:hypothetical protein
MNAILPHNNSASYHQRRHLQTQEFVSSDSVNTVHAIETVVSALLTQHFLATIVTATD